MKVSNSTPAEIRSAVETAFQPHPAPPRPQCDLPGVVELCAESDSPCDLPGVVELCEESDSPCDLPGVVELCEESDSPFAETANRLGFDPVVPSMTSHDEIEELLFRARNAGYRDGITDGIELGKKMFGPSNNNEQEI